MNAIIETSIKSVKAKYKTFDAVILGIATLGNTVESLFTVMMEYLRQMVSEDQTRDEHLRMHPVDFANYIRDIAGCQYSAYTANGVRVVPDATVSERKSISEKYKTLANLCAFYSRETADFARILPSNTLRDLDTNTRKLTVDATPQTVDAVASKDTITDISGKTSKLLKSNPMFVAEMRQILANYGVTVEQFEYETRIVKKRKK